VRFTRAGLSAADIHEHIDRLTVSSEDETWFRALLEEDLARSIRFLQTGSGRRRTGEGGCLPGFPPREVTGRSTFEELDIPLQVVATDLWTREQVVMASGDLWPAVNASMAMPGLFSPVKLDDRVLVDGGLTNPLPYDLLWDDCDIVIAVDVLGTRTRRGIPGAILLRHQLQYLPDHAGGHHH
jgi:NTE family protein